MPEVGTELYRLIKVSGADALEFLQGQLTQDVSLLENSANLPAAWCNPQGRVIATVRVIAIEDAIGLAVAEDICEDVCERLLRFRFRSDVSFEIAGDDWDGVATGLSANTEPSQTNELSVVAYESEMPLTEYFGLTSTVAAAVTDQALSIEDWQLRLIYAGVPFIGRANSEKFTPHMLNLDRLGAISFAKGCYTGQEIVARTEHRGSSKRRLLRYTTESESVAVGDKLTDGDRVAGEVVNVSGNNLLAVTPVAMQHQALTIGDALAQPAALPY
ncbi:MAG: folate-binding protein YgfZ [Woeseiaceae bacterium]|jgi:folate-binding protein YgfZ